MSLKRVMVKYNLQPHRLSKHSGHAVWLAMGIILGVLVHIIYLWISTEPHGISTYNARFYFRNHSFSFHAYGGKDISGKLGALFDLNGTSHVCSKNWLVGSRGCRLWAREVQFNLAQDTYQSLDHPDASCVDVKWKSWSHVNDPLDCILLGDNHMYGGAELEEQHWPIQKTTIRMQEYIPGARNTGMGYWSVLERYWLFSNGVAVIVDDSVPLHVSQSPQQLCFKASYTGTNYPRPDGVRPILKYKMCTAGDVKQTHLYMAQRFFARPKSVPDMNLVRYPLWSTWARYKKDINQTVVLEFVNQIKAHGYKSGYIGIDDMYTPTYGDLVFDTKKFSDAPGLLKTIHSMGFNVTSWVIPVAAVNSEAFQDGAKYGHWVKERLGKVAGTVYAPQGGVVASLDFTKPDAVDWYLWRLAALHMAGIDSFKFDLGECSFLPCGYRTHSKMPYPSYYITAYAEAATRKSGFCLEMRAAYKTQHLPIYVRIQDRYSTWGYELGLRSVIPTVLQVGLIGYPFIIPDMLAGNAYKRHGWPDKELYIRWLQLNMFLPVVQYSIPPWYFDDETIQIALVMKSLREKHVIPHVLRLAEESVQTGQPIIRPLWWADPQDSATFTIDSQFLLGDDVLVAPVLQEGARARDVYLPIGRWRNMISNQVVNGRQFVRNFPVDLHEILWFTRMT